MNNNTNQATQLHSRHLDRTTNSRHHDEGGENLLVHDESRTS